jgi:SAM-dependent methyltransferase
MRQLFKRSQFCVGLVVACRKIRCDLAAWRGIRARRKIIAAYLNATKIRKLQIGCGKNLLPGWLNADWNPIVPEVIYLDAAARFPFSDATFDFIFTEHMIEHIPFADGQAMLRECLRILKPGGKIRVSTPNLKSIASLVLEPLTPQKVDYTRVSTGKYIPANKNLLPGFVVNNFYWDFGHYFVYDPDTLPYALATAGFGQMATVRTGTSATPELCGLERHAQVVGANLDEFETMIFEATRSAAGSSPKLQSA